MKVFIKKKLPKILDAKLSEREKRKKIKWLKKKMQ